jgi:hypothetical protein
MIITNSNDRNFFLQNAALCLEMLDPDPDRNPAYLAKLIGTA